MFMHRIKLENILSFGPDAQDLALKPLNVLIGPNGAGKSNLIEVIGLLKAATNDMTTPMREGGGSENWMWRGEPTGQAARVEISVRGHPCPGSRNDWPGIPLPSVLSSLEHHISKRRSEKLKGPSKGKTALNASLSVLRTDSN